MARDNKGRVRDDSGMGDGGSRAGAPLSHLEFCLAPSPTPTSSDNGGVPYLMGLPSITKTAHARNFTKYNAPTMHCGDLTCCLAVSHA